MNCSNVVMRVGLNFVLQCLLLVFNLQFEFRINLSHITNLFIEDMYINADMCIFIG